MNCHPITTNRLGEDLPPGTCRQHGPPSEIRDPGCELGMSDEGSPHFTIGPVARTPEWLDARRHVLTSTDMVKILGEHLDGSAMSVYAAKILGEKPLRDSPKLRAGRVMQESIATLTQLEVGGEFEECERLLTSTRWPWLGCTPDYRYQDPELGATYLECKNTTEGEGWDDDRGPRRAFVQCQVGMAVTGCKVWRLSGLLWGYDLRPKVIHRDDDFIENVLIPAGEWMVELIAAQQLPEVDHSESCRKALLALYPDSEPETDLPANQQDEADDMEFFALKHQIEELTQRQDEIRNRLRKRLETIERLVLPDGRSWTHKGKNGSRTLRPPRKDAA